MRDKGMSMTGRNKSPLYGFFVAVLTLMLGWSSPGFAQNFTVPSAFIQTQTYEDPLLNHVEARILLRKDGALIDGSEIISVVLRDGSGWEMRPTSEPEFQRTNFIVTTWDPGSDLTWRMSGYSAFSLSYPALEAGMYSFELMPMEEEVITRAVAFPGMLELTPVFSYSMISGWLPDGSLLLGWWEPWWDFEFDQYRLTFTGPLGNEIFVGRTERGSTQVLLPPALLEDIRELGSTDAVHWRVMTTKRYESAGGIDYARSHSNELFLSLQPPSRVGPVTGLVLAADGITPPPYTTSITLQRLTEWGMEFVNQFYPWNGEFFFDSDWLGNVLTPGAYRVVVSAPGYTTALFEQYLDDGDVWDLGIVFLTAVPQAGSIGGRLVDRWSGAPLPGNSPPYAWVALTRLDEGGWGEGIGFQAPDSNGEFIFTPENSGPLYEGTYIVEVWADGYEYYRSGVFAAAAAEDVYLGDMPIVPVPITISKVTPCDPVFPGGICSFSFEVANRSNVSFRGAAWSVVSGWGIGSPLGSTVFQAAAKGTKKPLEQLSLKAGEVKLLTFEFPVPAALPDWATFCVDAYVGEDPDALFETVAIGWLFCVSKTPDGLGLLPEKKVREMRLHKGNAGGVKTKVR